MQEGRGEKVEENRKRENSGRGEKKWEKPTSGIEPLTFSLRSCCSATELRRRASARAALDLTPLPSSAPSPPPRAGTLAVFGFLGPTSQIPIAICSIWPLVFVRPLFWGGAPTPFLCLSQSSTRSQSMKVNKRRVGPPCGTDELFFRELAAAVCLFWV